MNILYSFRTRGVGAESVHISGIANALEALGHVVDFESPHGLDPRMQAGSNPYSGHENASFLHAIATRLPGPLFELAEIVYNFRVRRRVAQRLRQKPYGLVYERHAFFLQATSAVARKHGVPYVVEVNELVGDERIRKQPLMTPLCRQYDDKNFQRANLIVTVSPHLRRTIIEQHGIAEHKIVVHPNAVEADLLDKTPDPDPILQKFNLGGRLVVGFVGWFVQWHRLDLLLHAFARLCVQHAADDPLLLLAGDGPLKGDLQKLATDLGIADRLILTGSLPHENIPALLRALDIAVIPHSNAYRSPIKLFEYMAQACPVVAPLTEPIASVLKTGENGVLFEPLNEDQFAEALTQLAADPTLRERLGGNARRSVQDHHTWRHNAQDILARL